jgi:hypothetical protein
MSTPIIRAKIVSGRIGIIAISRCCASLGSNNRRTSDCTSGITVKTTVIIINVSIITSTVTCFSISKEAVSTAVDDHCFGKIDFLETAGIN